ncbi:Serine/threonine protein kinase [Parasponia andersonii]|uniref:Serine/threonine protein kinase n=1 Tax=Parasponia andersonii TaxID=3476 RepID=A0A2P5BJ25_PARAD|nr:Serine/threonine protein kinase [Parasponia andersonii]
MVAEFDYEELLKATGNFSPSRLIGKGSHGSVYAAKFIIRNNESLIVAVKKPQQILHGHDHHARTDDSNLENEIRVLSALPENPHIIKLLGTSHDSARNCRLLVMEFMPNGSLHDLLHVAETPPSWSKRVETVLQIAKAVRSLHGGVVAVPPHHQPYSVIVHRDIKSENVLFDSDWVAKLADFGLAVALDDVDSASDGPGPGQVPAAAGTIGYLDPCYTAPSKLSTKNDVFSFGVLVLEIVSGRKVMDVSRSWTSLAEWAAPLIRERRLDEIYDTRVPSPDGDVAVGSTVRELLYVAASCVSLEEDCRPSMSDVVGGMLGRLVRVDRFPIWMTSFLRGVMLVRIKRRKKLAKRWRQIKCDEAPIIECRQGVTQYGDDHDVPKRNRFTLRELLLAG